MIVSKSLNFFFGVVFGVVCSFGFVCVCVCEGVWSRGEGKKGLYSPRSWTDLCCSNSDGKLGPCNRQREKDNEIIPYG